VATALARSGEAGGLRSSEHLCPWLVRQAAIRLTVERESDDWISFTVTDTGIGMTEGQLGRLFEVFSQAEASSGGKYGGIGLGLAISHHFCRLMGGDLTVKSVYGHGSTFTVRLPLQVQMPVA
jgi:signal transduction histidine kinase